jgi:hypothetical protein
MNEVERQWLTLALMVSIAAFIIASDVWLTKFYGVNSTYSRVAAGLFDRYPVALVVVVFAIGVLIGYTLLPTQSR